MRDDDGNFLAYAKRPIKKGEEVCSESSFCLNDSREFKHPMGPCNSNRASMDHDWPRAVIQQPS